MKKHIYLIGAVALLVVLITSGALAAAQPAGSQAAQAGGTLEGPRWVLVSYTAENGKMASALPDVETTAQFADGTVSGSTGCNAYNAPYEAKGSNE